VIAVALETSSPRGSVAVRVGSELRELELAVGRTQATDLLPTLERLLSELGGGGRIGAVLVGLGPGSYTGLRIGVATALGVAFASGALLRGVDSFEALAWRELAAGEEGDVLLDARGGCVYWSRLRRTPTGIETLEAACALEPRAAGECVRGRPIALAEPECLALLGLSPRDVGELRTGRVPAAGAVLELGLAALERAGPQRPEELEPRYLRAFGARPRRG
jgi:tRNA threonylcarbamoyl adenosine modification protein YeaZ